MTVMAALLMLCCIAALQLVAAAGLADSRRVHWFSLVCCLGLIVVYSLVRSGYSQRWEDPALTFLQIIASVTCTAVAYVIAGSARGITLPILAVILIFGVFGLSPRQMLFVLSYGVTVFAVALTVVQWSPGHGDQPLALSIAYMVMIAVVLVSCTFINLRVLAARKRKIELIQAAANERERAIRDELTGLHNRRFMLEMLHLEGVRVQRNQQPLLVAQLDLDNFKNINDTHGHAAGDLVLTAFAQTVSACIRSTDMLARWGGEEFVLLMGNTTADNGAGLLERLRAAVQAAVVFLPSGASIRVTVSIGAAQLQPGQETPLGLLGRADAALYAAKAQGRNRVAWADEAVPNGAVATI
ncbi:MAG: GGDEF domain-containing protein [Proteobacteria bacterium]|nr:GGDEF domain-containing protein [Pseudomonadota bacterium]